MRRIRVSTRHSAGCYVDGALLCVCSMASGGSERQEYVKNSKERSKCNDQKLWYFDEMKRTVGNALLKR